MQYVIPSNLPSKTRRKYFTIVISFCDVTILETHTVCLYVCESIRHTQMKWNKKKTHTHKELFIYLSMIFIKNHSYHTTENWLMMRALAHTRTHAYNLDSCWFYFIVCRGLRPLQLINRIDLTTSPNHRFVFQLETKSKSFHLNPFRLKSHSEHFQIYYFLFCLSLSLPFFLFLWRRFYLYISVDWKFWLLRKTCDTYTRMEYYVGSLSTIQQRILNEVDCEKRACMQKYGYETSEATRKRKSQKTPAKINEHFFFFGRMYSVQFVFKWRDEFHAI